MAKSMCGGKAGSAVFTGGCYADWTRFTISGSHFIEDTTKYVDTSLAATHRGSGTPSYAWEAEGILAKGTSGVAGGVGVTTSVSPFAATGGYSCVFTLDTGVTETGTCIYDRFTIAHAKTMAAIRLSVGGMIDGDLTEVWAVS